MDPLNQNLLHASMNDNLEAVKEYLRNGADIDVTDRYGNTLLHMALKRGNTDMAELLISCGADLNIKAGWNKETPLHMALKKGCKDTATSLILKGANLNVKCKYGNTPLNLALQTGKIDTAALLISRGADVNIYDLSKDTPLHLAANKGFIDMAALLISMGAEVDFQNDKGKSPLHMALETGKTDTAALLISRGAEINVRDVLKQTPLHLAASKDYIDIADLLISKGAEINVKNDKERTPLHLSAMEDYTDMVALLILRGSDITLRDQKGYTARYLAKGKTKILMQLVGKGITAEKANEALKHSNSLDEANKYIQTHPSPAVVALSKASESSKATVPAPVPESNDTKTGKINQNVALRGIVDAEEFKELLSTGLYESFWNRIYLAGACNVGKTTLATLLIGEDIPKYWKSTDGLRIYFGRNGIDVKRKTMIPLKKEHGRRDVLSKVLRGHPNIVKPLSETSMKILQEETRNITHNLKISSLHEIESPSKVDGQAFLPSSDPGGRNETQIPTKTDTTERRMQKRTQNLASIKISSVHEEIKQEVRRGDYKVEIAPSDLVDFGGQRSYDMTHQLFIQSKGTFTLLCDGRKGLRDPLDEYPQGDITTEAILKHWVDSILTYCGDYDDDILPVILFVATHGDCLTEDEKRNKIVEFKDGLLKLFEKHDQCRRIKYNDIFFINGTNIHDPEVKRLKDKYVEIAFKQKSWGNKMPMAWVPLELQMSEMRTYNFSIISKDDLLQMNKGNDDLALSEKQLDKFLKAQHALGKIIYIEGQGLDQYVIVQPTTLVDILRSFITDEMFWPEITV